MGNTFGKLFQITSFGESHGAALGVVVDGCPARLNLSEQDIQAELDRRKPGTSKISTQRKEDDKVEILSGVFEGVTTGAPIAMIIRNKDQKSGDYDELKNIFRPGHADFTYFEKFGVRDHRGGGRSSGRETVSRVAAGAIAKKILDKLNIDIFGFVKKVGEIEAKDISKEEIEKNSLRFPDKNLLAKALKNIEELKKQGDSMGSLVEIRVQNIPIGLGEPVFEKLDAEIAKALFSIGAIKGVEIGSGFSVVEKKGSENNDELILKDKKVSSEFNNAGGILGGISNGEEIVIRCAVKPTPSISKSQTTLGKDLKEKQINIKGRHDPIIGPRLVPVAEAMIAITLADFIMRDRSRKIF